MAQVTTLSSVGTSAAIVLNPTAKATTIQVSVTATSSGNYYVQLTLDDPSTTPAPTVTWTPLSSVFSSSTLEAAGGVIYTVLSPLGGVRLLSTAVTTTTVTLKALQAVTA